MIRRLNPWELTDVTPIARAFHAEAALGGPFSRELFEGGLHKLSAQGVLYVCGLYRDDVLSGVLCGILAPHFMSGDIIAQEMFWYVLPACRGSMDAVRMLKDFEQWSKDNGAAHMVMANFHAEANPEGVASLYRRNGFKAVETHHLKSF